MDSLTQAVFGATVGSAVAGPRLGRRAALWAAAFCLLAAPLGARAADVTVFAAASLKNAMDEITAQWTEESGLTAVVSLAGSSALARQIEQGAPADVFISANVRWMDYLEDRGLIAPETRLNLVRNRLVLIAHGADADPVAIAPGMDLAGMLGEGRLAMALVDAVPAGIYGKAAFETLGVWDALAPKVAQADNVRAALALVSTGAAPMGVVYATDAAADDGVSVVGTFPAETHPPIVYPAAALAGRADGPAAAFLAFLRGPEARAAFERQGFAMAADPG
jgi:molybdate transport system substrate-binding protein